MSGFIKKVGTTPVRGNGFIIDSFNTTDNKEFNAPSLRAVEDRTDNNLLLCGVFMNFPTGGQKVNGWQISDAIGYSGTPAQFNPVVGLYVPSGYHGTIISPQICAFDTSDFDTSASYSVTVIFADNDTTYTGKMENLTEEADPVADETLESKLRVRLGTFYNGGGFRPEIWNVSNSSLFIKAIKLEKGSSCTPVKMVGKEYGIFDLVKSYLSDKITTITGTFTTNASGEASAIVNYPTSFTKENCVVLSAGISDKDGNYHYYKTGSDKTSTREYVMLNDGYVNIYYQGTSTDASATLNYRVVLYKF